MSLLICKLLWFDYLFPPVFEYFGLVLFCFPATHVYLHQFIFFTCVLLITFICITWFTV